MSHTCCNRQKVKRGLWSPEEDRKLIHYVSIYGHGCWSTVPKLAGLQRCGKSCRLRWINYLRPDLKRGNFTPQEAALIIELHRLLGNRWAQIAKHLPGRTDNEVKNFWNSTIKKKLLTRALARPTPQNNIMERPNPIPIPNPNPDYQGFEFDPEKPVDYEAVMSLMPKPSVHVPHVPTTNVDPWPAYPVDPPLFKPDESVMFGFDYSNPTLLDPLPPMYDQDAAMFDAVMPELVGDVFPPPPPPPPPPEVVPPNHIKHIQSLMPSFSQPLPGVYMTPPGEGGDGGAGWGFY